VKLIPDGLPFWVFARQVEFGQDAFEPVDDFGMALKPRIDTTFVKKGFDLVHRFYNPSDAAHDERQEITTTGSQARDRPTRAKPSCDP
jgi:hypothetical protein